MDFIHTIRIIRYNPQYIRHYLNTEIFGMDVNCVLVSNPTLSQSLTFGFIGGEIPSFSVFQLCLEYLKLKSQLEKFPTSANFRDRYIVSLLMTSGESWAVSAQIFLSSLELEFWVLAFWVNFLLNLISGSRTARVCSIFFHVFRHVTYYASEHLSLNTQLNMWNVSE